MLRPLAGLRIIELVSAGAGPRAGALLAYLGAEVIRVDTPTPSDVILQQGPTQRGLPIGYAFFNVGTKSVTLDLRIVSDYDAFTSLMRNSDAFITNLRPGAAKRLGADHTTLLSINPALVYGELSGWGTRGPLAGFAGADQIIQWYSGWASVQGASDGPAEASRGGGQIDATSAFLLVIGLLAKLCAREAEKGRGGYVGTSLLSAAITLQSPLFGAYVTDNLRPPRGSRDCFTAPNEAFPCSDGRWIAISVLDDTDWRACCTALDLKALLVDTRFATNASRLSCRDDLSEVIGQTTRRAPFEWWDIQLSKYRVPHGAFYEWETIKYHSHVRANRLIQDVIAQGGRRIKIARPPLDFDGQRGSVGRPPTPGSTNRDITSSHQLNRALRSEGQSGYRSDSRALSAASPIGETEESRGNSQEEAADSTESLKGPLGGVVVLDSARGQSGTVAGLLLALLGARVIKIEDPDAKSFRTHGSTLHGPTSAEYAMLNREKQHIVLRLGTPEGVRVLETLIEKADILIEDWNDTPTYKLNAVGRPSSLIHGSVSAFGEVGSLAGRGGSELVIQAMTGNWREVALSSKGPCRVGVPIASMASGLLLASALLALLLRRRREGIGGRVSTSDFGALLYVRGPVWASLSEPDNWIGWAAKTHGEADTGWATADGPVYLLPLRDKGQRWAEFTQRLASGAAPLATIADEGKSGSQDQQLELTEQLRQRSGVDVVRIATEAGVLASELHRYDELPHLSQIESTGIFRGDPQLPIGSPWLFDRSYRLPAFSIIEPGADTRALLKELCGLTETESKALKDAGIVDWPS